MPGGAHELFTSGDEKVEEVSNIILLGLNHKQVVVVVVVIEEVSGKKGHNINRGGTHLQVLLQYVIDLSDGFSNELQFHDDGSLT